MSTLVLSIVIVAGSVLASLAGLFLVNRWADKDTLRKHHELAGHMLAVVGTLNAILLGLVVVEAQNRYQQARTMEAQEASGVADLMRFCDSLPNPARREFRTEIRRYVYDVVNLEWDSNQQEKAEPTTLHDFAAIWKSVCDYQPTDNRQQNIHQSMLSSIQSVADCRRFRLTAGRHSLPPVLWTVMIVGATITVLFTYFFTFENIAMQVLMTILLVIILSLNIVLVKVLGHPYSGDWRIRPDQFTRVWPRSVRSKDPNTPDDAEPGNEPAQPR